MNAKELGAQPAMPSSSGHQDARNIGWIGGGLTKRELFAAMAMQGICMQGYDGGVPQAVASNAVYAADKLLAALAKDQP